MRHKKREEGMRKDNKIEKRLIGTYEKDIICVEERKIKIKEC